MRTSRIKSFILFSLKYKLRNVQQAFHLADKVYLISSLLKS